MCSGFNHLHGSGLLTRAIKELRRQAAEPSLAIAYTFGKTELYPLYYPLKPPGFLRRTASIPGTNPAIG